MLDTSLDAFIAAYRRQDKATCMAISRAIRASADFVRRDCWVNPRRDETQADHDEERQFGWSIGK